MSCMVYKLQHESLILYNVNPEVEVVKYDKNTRLISELSQNKILCYKIKKLTGPPNVRKRRPVFPPAGRSIVPVHSLDGVSYFLPV